MKYCRLTILFSLLILTVNLRNTFSQEINGSKLEVHNSSHITEIDQYGFIYDIEKDNLIKYDSQGNELYNYSNKLLGEITQIDISNPLRPLLFYKDQGIILALDNTLSQQKSQISLNELGLYQTNCISNSNFDNGIWLYDLDVNEIIKINYFSKVDFKSGNLSVILPNMDFPILKLQEKNRLLYAVTKRKIFVFDQFGSLLNVINLCAKNGIIIKEKQILAYDGNFIMNYNILDFKTDTLFKSNKYSKIIDGYDKIIGISKDKSRVSYIDISK